MSFFTLTMVSAIPVYHDELHASKLAPRSATLDGKVVCLLPNWRPSAMQVLEALGALLKERYRLKDLIVEESMRAGSPTEGKVIDSVRGRLDEIAQRVDVVLTASGD